MKKRVISAIIALIIVVPLIALGGYAYYAGVGLLAIIGFNEIISVREKERKFPVVVKCLTLVSFLAIILFINVSFYVLAYYIYDKTIIIILLFQLFSFYSCVSTYEYKRKKKMQRNAEKKLIYDIILNR